MHSTRITATCALALSLLNGVSAHAAETEPSWTRWGGPDGDFRADGRDLADSWPEGGPRRLWSREIGDGYSAVLFEAGRLYTMARIDTDEAVVALSAREGSEL